MSIFLMRKINSNTLIINFTNLIINQIIIYTYFFGPFDLCLSYVYRLEMGTSNKYGALI